MEIKEIERQETEILELARQAGVSETYLFTTTFERYRVLIRTCENLRKAFEKEDVTVSKEYVKGRENIVLNPAIRAYNTTATTANKTAESLLKLVDSLGMKSTNRKESKLMLALRGETEEKVDDPLLKLLNE